MLTYVGDAIMGSTHEGFDTRLAGYVKRFNDGSVFLEFHGLRHGLFVRNMVDSKKLVIAK
jgi:hypothetical protein